jgi:two-component system CheB/CheR fusion protein
VTVHEPPPATPELQKEADRILLARYAPASVMVNADYEILQFRGDTGKYLAPAPGRASLNLLKMLREGLLVAVRASLHLAGKDEAPVRKERLKVRSNGGFEDVNVEVIPVRGGTDSTSFLVLFEPSDGRPATGRGRQGQQRVDTRTERDRADRESARLTQELAATREYLQSVIEQQEAANEELQSANEEVQSANEELQSINEELETSKEEVQSSNEELATVNDELNHRNAELSLTNNDLLNLLASVQMAIVIVGADLRIRRFTPTAERMLNLIPADVGRPIKDLNLNLSLRDFGQQLAEVIDSVSATDHEVVDKNGRWQLLRLRPYRTVDNQIDGAVIALIDIDPLKRNEETLRRQTKLLEHTDDPIVMWEIGGAITYWNRAAERLYGFSKEQALNRRPHELLTATPSQYEIEASLQKNGRWRGHLTVTRHDGARVVVESRMALVREIDGRDYVVEAVHAVDEEPARGIQEDR